MSGADEDIDKYTLTTQTSLGFHSMKPEGKPGVPEQIDLAYDEDLPSAFWEVEQDVQVLDIQGSLKNV